MNKLDENNIKRAKVIKMINDSAKAISNFSFDNNKENTKILCHNLGIILNNAIIFDETHVKCLSKDELYYYFIILNKVRSIFINLIDKQINKINKFTYDNIENDDDDYIDELIKFLESIYK